MRPRREATRTLEAIPHIHEHTVSTLARARIAASSNTEDVMTRRSMAMSPHGSRVVGIAERWAQLVV